MEDVKSLIVNDSGELPCLNIVLKDKKKIVLYSDDIEEVSELLVAKLKHFTANKLLQIGKLKKLWNLKQTSYDSNNSTHENMLMKFWNSLFSDISIERISSDWSKIGFQGKVRLLFRLFCFHINFQSIGSFYRFSWWWHTITSLSSIFRG